MRAKIHLRKMSAAFRTEQIYVTRRVKRGLLTLALLRGATAGHDVAGANQTADALANEVLEGFLAGQPALVERETAVQEALRAVDRQFNQKQT